MVDHSRQLNASPGANTKDAANGMGGVTAADVVVSTNDSVKMLENEMVIRNRTKDIIPCISTRATMRERDRKRGRSAEVDGKASPIGSELIRIASLISYRSIDPFL